MRWRHQPEGFAHAPSVRRMYEPLPPPFADVLGLEEAQRIHDAAVKRRFFGEDYEAHQLPTPVNHAQRTKNELRPETLREMVGQAKMRDLLERLIDIATLKDRVLDHVLLVAPAGTGKSTIAHAIANEIGTNCYAVEAPVGHDTLLDLRQVCARGDVVFIDEIHQQAIGDRRGRTNNTTPEVFYGVLEDRTLVSGAGVLDFPEITFVGGTTDEGALPDPFVMRFPIRPAFEPYTVDELRQIALMNAASLGKHFTGDGALTFAKAARLTPRVVNSYVRNAAGLALGDDIDDSLVQLVLDDLNGVAADGLTADQQKLLKWLLEYGKTTSRSGTMYKASVATLATAIGKGRDTKAIVLRVEPYLLSAGLLRITTNGRALTDKGIKRARQI